MSVRSLLLGLTVGAAMASPCAAGPVGWRNDGTGHFPNASPVTEWDIGTGKNVVWRTPTPRWSNSSPIVVGNRVMVTGEPDRVYCLDAGTGRIMWTADISLLGLLGDSSDASALRKKKAEKDMLEERVWKILQQVIALSDKTDGESSAKSMELKREGRDLKRAIKAMDEKLAEAAGTKGLKWRTVGYAMSTPVSDGRYVWVKSGTGAVACLDMEGKAVWLKRFDYDGTETSVSSPVLVPAGNGVGRSVLVFARVPYDPDRRYRSEKTERSKVIAALDAVTGGTVWETAPLRNAGWGSGGPVPARMGDARVLITGGGDVLRAADGHVLATGVAMGGSSTAVVDGDVVFLCDDKKMSAVQLEPASNGKVNHAVLWETTIVEKSGNSYGLWSSPLIHGGHIYAVDGLANGFVIDRTDGKIVGKFTPLDHNPRKAAVYTSLSLVDGKIFVASMKKGYGAFFEATPRAKTVSQLGPFGEALYSTPFFSGDRLYIRTQTAVYCIGAK